MRAVDYDDTCARFAVAFPSPGQAEPQLALKDSVAFFWRDSNSIWQLRSVCASGQIQNSVAQSCVTRADSFDSWLNPPTLKPWTITNPNGPCAEVRGTYRHAGAGDYQSTTHFQKADMIIASTLLSLKGDYSIRY